MQENITTMLTGRVYWFRGLVGQLALNYEEDGKEWSFELEATPATQAWLKENGLLDKLKRTKDGELKVTPDGSNYLRFHKPEFNREGEASKPWRVVDKDGAPWDSNVFVGNGSVVRVKVSAKSFTMKGRTVKGLYAMAIQVGEHVPYERNEFGAWDAEPAPRAAAKPAKKDALEDFIDDNPFDE